MNSTALLDVEECHDGLEEVSSEHQPRRMLHLDDISTRGMFASSAKDTEVVIGARHISKLVNNICQQACAKLWDIAGKHLHTGLVPQVLCSYVLHQHPGD